MFLPIPLPCPSRFVGAAPFLPLPVRLSLASGLRAIAAEGAAADGGGGGGGGDSRAGLQHDASEGRRLALRTHEGGVRFSHGTAPGSGGGGGVDYGDTFGDGGRPFSGAVVGPTGAVLRGPRFGAAKPGGDFEVVVDVSLSVAGRRRDPLLGLAPAALPWLELVHSASLPVAPGALASALARGASTPGAPSASGPVAAAPLARTVLLGNTINRIGAAPG